MYIHISDGPVLRFQKNRRGRLISVKVPSGFKARLFHIGCAPHSRPSRVVGNAEGASTDLTQVLIQPFFLVLITALAIYLPYFSLGTSSAPTDDDAAAGAIER